MAFFNQAITVLQTLVIALGAGLGIWGVINLLPLPHQKRMHRKRARLRIRSRSSRVRRASLPRSRLPQKNCPKMLRMSCLRTVKVRRAVAAAEAEDAAASRMAKTVPRNRIPAKNEKKSETVWFRSFSVCQ